MKTSEILSKSIQIGLGWTAPSLIESHVVDGFAAPAASGVAGYLIYTKTPAKEAGLAMMGRSVLNIAKRLVSPTPGSTVDKMLPGSTDKSMFTMKMNGLPGLSGMRGMGMNPGAMMLKRHLNGTRRMGNISSRSLLVA